MDRVTRLRRVALLCCHFVKNYAYYEAGWDNKIPRTQNEFWVTVQNNFIDMAVLEWIKLFGNYNTDEHHWKKIFNTAHAQFKFKKDMLANCSITDEEFSDLHKQIKEYRDKFIGHLDSDEVMHVPHLSNALKLVYFYYNEVIKELVENERQGFSDIKSYYEKCFNGSKIYFGK